MSNLISLDSVSYRAGNKQLFSNLKLAVPDRARLGIIGPNGSGKSTLLKVMAGILPPEEGQVVVSRGTRVIYVPQADDFAPDLTLQQVMLEALTRELPEQEALVRIAKIFSQLGFEDSTRKVSELSGGWRKRLALAQALALEPDILLLDEPTNHLDLSGLIWLEKLLLNAKFAWVLISHDRYFLERTVGEVMEVAPYYPQGVLRLSGNYTTFLQKREEYLEQEARNTASLANKVRNEQEWASRGPRARTTKATYRLKSVDRLEQELQERRSRQQTDTKQISFTSSSRQTRDLVELINVSFSYEKKSIIEKLNYTLTNGRCLGVLGTNGQGKSTLLKLIGGSLPTQSGKVKQAAHLKTVYFDQLRTALSSARTLKEALADGYDQVIYQDKPIHIISWAKRFGFEMADLDKKLTGLSGGEQARVLLSILVRQEADLLILDEPTNDLDIPMLEALEVMLTEFEGAIVIVTHDRFMLENVCTDFLGFTENQVLTTYASYQQWEDDRRALAATQTSKSVKVEAKRLSEQERKELGQMERKITKAEQQLQELQLKAADPELYADAQASIKMATELKAAEQLIAELYQRWEELEAR